MTERKLSITDTDLYHISDTQNKRFFHQIILSVSCGGGNLHILDDWRQIYWVCTTFLQPGLENPVVNFVSIEVNSFEKKWHQSKSTLTRNIKSLRTNLYINWKFNQVLCLALFNLVLQLKLVSLEKWKINKIKPIWKFKIELLHV